MELLKVFVGDASGVALSVAAMVPGDLLLLDAATYTPLAANTSGLTSKDVVIASCISKNGVNTPVFSTPIKKTNIKYITAVNDNEASVAETTSTTVVNVTSTGIAAGTTHSLGIQIKEDLRMGTYNKNTEVIASYVVPSSGVPTDVQGDLTSTLAKGFAANPLTSAGSPYQLVKVVRTATGGTTLSLGGTSVTVTQGGREVKTSTASGRTAGQTVNLGGNVYLIESVSSTTSFVLDTAYQGPSATLTPGATPGSTAASYYTVLPTGISFVFTAVAQSQKNRYDQFRMVDFVVISPKGNDLGLFTTTKTAAVYPVGSYAQVRDLEEKAYTNSNPLINYREFPFETFPLNATSGTYYCMVNVSYTSGWGYNMMQSNQPEFLQTAVIAAPFAADGQFDVTPTTTNAGSFLETWSAWAGAPTSGSYTFS